MDTRAFIEYGVGSRWEFDKKILFGQVEHIAKVSADIAEVAKVRLSYINYFLKLLLNLFQLLNRPSTNSKTCLDIVYDPT